MAWAGDDFAYDLYSPPAAEEGLFFVQPARGPGAGEGVHITAVGPEQLTGTRPAAPARAPAAPAPAAPARVVERIIDRVPWPAGFAGQPGYAGFARGPGWREPCVPLPALRLQFDQLHFVLFVIILVLLALIVRARAPPHYAPAALT